mmetsp:Transcript_39765/g.100212  ORF Transcript_39765/g.100212 Transcript_39765/m.100212 type:complete len:824 (-) Transcript_39765:9-2480(-)
MPAGGAAVGISSIQPAAEWQKLHDRYYKKHEDYALDWQPPNLQTSFFAAAENAGPMAICESFDEPCIVTVYSLAGRKITSIQWTHSSRLVAFGWNNKEQLVCVSEDSLVCLFDIYGDLLSKFPLSKAPGEHRIVACRFWPTGVVALTQRVQFLAVESYDRPRPHLLTDPQCDQPPTAWTLIPPEFTAPHHVEVLVATTTGTILVVDSTQCQDQLLSNGPFSSLSVSPTGRILACFTAASAICIFTTDFTKNLSEFPTKSKTPPQQMVWCGPDCVLMQFDKLLLLIGPFGKHLKFTYSDPFRLIPETDGVRIVSTTKCEFLGRVPNCSVDTFAIGSTSPSALLFEAWQQYESKNPGCDDRIRTIEADLTVAIEGCIEAGANDLDPHYQKALMKAASFGKCFLDSFPPDVFVDTCRAIRVVNAVRAPSVGLPLTYPQYQTLSCRVLVDRLAMRRHHLLAFRICTYMSLKPDQVLINWARAKVLSKDDDDRVCKLVVEKLQQVPGISYAEIASTAFNSNKLRLATMLLEHEPRAADKVPLLLNMKKDELALAKAIESGDTDLVFLVILHIKRTSTLPKFLQTICAAAVARDLYISYCKEQDWDMLSKIYAVSGNTTDAATIRVLDAYKKKDLNEKINGLQAAMQKFAEGKDGAFSAKATEDQIRLLLIQKDLENDTGKPFLDTSISDTIHRLFLLNMSARAVKLKAEFKVPDKRFWWIKIKALAAMHAWRDLQTFAKEKKSPIGYEPFAEVCVEQGAAEEALLYIPKIEDAGTRITLCMRINRFREAADIVYKELKDPNALDTLKAKCQAPDVRAYIDQLRSQLLK